MKITLVIPCYNEELNIQKGVLDKIGNFTDSNVDIVEVIISDDGSTDSTKNIPARAPCAAQSNRHISNTLVSGKFLNKKVEINYETYRRFDFQ